MESEGGKILGEMFSFSIWLILKIGFLFALGLYILFALIVLRQVYMMTKVIDHGSNWLIKGFAWLHFFFSLSVFLFAFFFL